MKKILITMMVLGAFTYSCQENQLIAPSIEEVENKIVITDNWSKDKDQTVNTDYNNCEDYYADRCAGQSQEACSIFRLRYSCTAGNGFIVLTDNWSLKATTAESERELTIGFEINTGSGNTIDLPYLTLQKEDQALLQLELVSNENGVLIFSGTAASETILEGTYELKYKDFMITSLNFTIKDRIIV